MTARSPSVDPPRDWCDELIGRVLREIVACQEPCADIWCCIEQKIWWPMYVRRRFPSAATATEPGSAVNSRA